MVISSKGCLYIFSAFIALLFQLIPAKSQQVWDSLYLVNGQVLFGELKKISLGKVQFDADDFTESNIKISKIKTIKATSQLYRIETISRKVFFSTIEPGKRSGYVFVGDSSGGAEIPLNYIALLSYYSDKRNIFEGNVSAGFNYTKSSNIGRFNLDANLRYIMKKFVIKNTTSAIITSDDGDWYRERETVALSGTYLINSKWKALGLLNYQRNKELGLEFRFQEGGGMGYNLIAKSGTRLAAFSGLVVNQEKSFTEAGSQVTAEIPMIIDFDFFNFSKPEISIANYHNFYFSISQIGRIRYDGELRVEWKIISDFFVNLKLYFNYDTQPLSGTSVNSDYGTVFGIGYKWD